MKKLNILIAALSIFFFMVSCEDEDKATYLPAPELEQGAYFRNIVNEGIINKNDIASSSYSITGELVAKDVKDVSAIDFMVSYTDNATDGEQSVDPVLIQSVDPSSLTLNSNGFPEASFNATGSEALTALGLDSSDLDGGDIMIFSIVIRMVNGTVFRAVNTGDSVRGELFFASPMDYGATVVCLNAPIPGEWQLDMEDLYGDGWNGGNIVVNMDGVQTTYSVSAASGTTQSETIVVPEGTQVFTWTYTAGNWETENVYTLTDPEGTVVLDEGPTPREGELLNGCAD